MHHAYGFVLLFYLLLFLMSALQTTLQNFPYRLILGSASPRRQELLKSLGFQFECKPINADESTPADLVAQEIPLFLSEHKSRSYLHQLKSNELLITADTVVWCNG